MQEDRIEFLHSLHIRSHQVSGKAKCEPGWNWRPQPLKDFDLWYVTAGSGTMIINDVTYSIEPGHCFIVRRNDRVMADQNLEDRLSVIFIHFELYKGSDQLLDETHPSLPARRILLKNKFAFESLLHRLLEIDEEATVSSRLEFEYLFKAALVQLYEAEEEEADADPVPYKHKQLIRRIIRHMKENLAEEPSYEELGELAGVSPRYLNRLFKRYTGWSIRDYKVKVRLDRAIQLISESSMSLSQVSEILGYTDLYFFSKQFKQHYGVAPSHFRAQAKESSSHYGPRKR